MGNSASRCPDDELLDLQSRIAIVTGANSGIGLYIVLHLARRGAKVYMAARSKQKADEAIARLKTEGLQDKFSGNILWLPFDLTDPRKAKASAQYFLELEQRLDILVNNAAKILSPYGQTPDGISDSVMINHISPFLFTKTLLSVLRRTASTVDSDVRIVNVSSVAHRWISNPRYDSFEALNSDFADTLKPSLNLYSYTKLANILWTKELQRQFDLEKVPIVAISVHPGNVMSEGNVKLFRSWPCGQLVERIFSLFFIDAKAGGYTPAWAAASHEIAMNRERFKGAYIVPYGTVEDASQDAGREDLARDLWRVTECILDQHNWY